MIATFLIASGMGSRRAKTETDADRGRRRAVRGRRRSRLGLAGLGCFMPLMSAKARLWLVADLGLSLAGGERAAAATASFERQEPNLGGRAGPSLAPQAEEEFDEDEDEDEEEEPAARAPRKKAAPRAPARKSSDKFELPSVSVLSAPKASDRQPLSKVGARSQFARAGRRARRFRRSRRNRQGPSRPGRDAVRTRARARHQVVARDRACRRHRALDERAVGPRCRRRPAATPSASNCRTRIAKRSICANCWSAKETTNRSRSCRSASARTSAANPSSSISRARRIC